MIPLPTVWRPSQVPRLVDDGYVSPDQSTLQLDSVVSSDAGTRRATESLECPFGQEERDEDPLCTACHQVCEPKLCKVCKWCQDFYHRGCEARFTIGRFFCIELCSECHKRLTKMRRYVQEEHEQEGLNWTEETWLHQTVRDFRKARPIPRGRFEHLHRYAKALYHMLRNGVELKDVYGVQSENPLGPLAEMLPTPDGFSTSDQAHSAQAQRALDGDSVPTSDLESALRAKGRVGKKGKGKGRIPRPADLPTPTMSPGQPVPRPPSLPPPQQGDGQVIISPFQDANSRKDSGNGELRTDKKEDVNSSDDSEKNLEKLRKLAKKIGVEVIDPKDRQRVGEEEGTKTPNVEELRRQGAAASAGDPLPTSSPVPVVPEAPPLASPIPHTEGVNQDARTATQGIEGMTAEPPPVQGRRLCMDEFEAERPQRREAGSSNDPSRSLNELGLKSPYVQPDQNIWTQSLLAKVLVQMKDVDISKLKFIEGAYRPIEYEKWIMSVDRLMQGLHPEIGVYWKKALKDAEVTYFKYLKDVSSTRVSLQPKPDMDLLTDIEARIEARMKPLLMSAVPQVVNQQCMFLEDLNCTQVLYRTMVMAGPASKEDRIYA